MEWLKAEFEKEMELIREEESYLPLHDQIVRAGSRVSEKADRYIGRLQEQRWAGHLEAVNLAHYG